MWNNGSLRTKLTLAFSVSASFLLIQGGVTQYYTAKTVSQFREIVTTNLPNLELLHRMEIASQDIEVPVEGISGTHNTKAQAEHGLAQVGQAIKEFESAAHAYEQIPFLPGEEKAWQQFKTEHWEPYAKLSVKIFQMSLDLSPAGFLARDELVTKEFEPLHQRLAESFDGLKKIQTDAIHHDSESAVQSSSVLTRVLWLVALGGLGLALGIGMLFSRRLAQSLQTIAERLGNGSEQVAAAAKSISASGTELSSSTTEQAAALQETVSSVDEISAMVSKNADNAKKSQDISQRSQQTAARGKETVQEMMQAIDEISRSNDEITAQIETSNREISDIVKVISEIGSKTRVINDIVFQTKLLSFNASVEAARAGEHGKGFAVVAEEVGNLAQMSGNAAKEISQMLEGSIQRVEKIVTDTRTKVERLVVTGKSKVETGTNTAKRCGTVLEEIVTNVVEVNQMINEIATASHEQSQGVHEITKAMAQLDQVTQQNAAASQQSANASEQLSAQADELRGLVQNLRATVQGGSASSVSGAPESEAPPSAKVIPFPTPVAEAAEPVGSATAPVAVGSDVVPSENDPRFEDA